MCSEAVCRHMDKAQPDRMVKFMHLIELQGGVKTHDGEAELQAQ